MPSRRRLLSALAAAGLAGGAAACTPLGPTSDPVVTTPLPTSGASDGGGAEQPLTFRMWDRSMLPAYEESFEAFMRESGREVTIDLVPWNEYWTRLEADVAAGTAADVYWMNSANYVRYQQIGALRNISEAMPDASKQWELAVVELYSRQNSLWGVPQLWDSTALYVNQRLLESEDIDAGSLAFDPAADSDPLREAARLLTADSAGRHPGDSGFDAAETLQFAVNSQADRQAILGPFVAANGGSWQDADALAFASPEGIAAIEYLVDLIHKAQVAPPAATTNSQPQFPRTLFTQSRLALLQTGSYALKSIHDGIGRSFSWGLERPIPGPAGTRSLVHGVVAVGNAKASDSRQGGIGELLAWLGSVEGQLPIAAQGVSFPGHVDAQQEFIDYWAQQDVDVSVFVDAAATPTDADTGANANAGLDVAMPILRDVFAGEEDVASGVQRAEDEGNAAMV